eukprot:NODE_67_length_25542_cov_1.476831.p22 type:complete len:106 gc:universal NODE_67_length_25542_cov_1.476831:14923-15240(+)
MACFIKPVRNSTFLKHFDKIDKNCSETLSLNKLKDESFVYKDHKQRCLFGNKDSTALYQFCKNRGSLTIVRSEKVVHVSKSKNLSSSPLESSLISSPDKIVMILM